MISAGYCLTFFQTSADRLSEQYFFYLNTDTKYKTFIHFQSSQMICLSVKHSSSVKVFWYYYFVQINAMSMDSCSKSTNIEVCCPVPCLVGIDSYVTACEVFPIFFFFFSPGPETEVRGNPWWSWTQEKAQAVKLFITWISIWKRQSALVSLVLVSVFVLQAVIMYCVKPSVGLISWY